MARKAKYNEIKIVKSIPSSENGSAVVCKTRAGQEYIISQNIERCRFTLWKVVEGGYVKIDTADSPRKFDEIIYLEKSDTSLNG